MFPINFNFPYRKKDGSIITMEKALDGAGADLDLIDLDDVAITSPAEGDGLIYDNTAHKWKNIPIISRIVALFNAWKKNGAYNDLPMTLVNKVINGATATVNADGSVTIDTAGSATTGVANFVWDFPSFGKVGEKYRLVGCPSGGGADTYYVNIYDNEWSDGTKDYGSGKEITIGTGITQAVISIRSGVVVDHLTFKLMITTDLNATYADYVPYAKTNRELTEDTRKIVTIIDTMPTTATNKPVGGCPVGYVLIGADVYNGSDNRWDSMPVGVFPDRPCYITSYSDSTTTYARPYLESGGVTAYGGQTFRAQFMRVN